MAKLSQSGYENLVSSIIMAIIATSAVATRFFVRKGLRQKPSIAEWLCVLSLCIFLGYIAVMLHYIFHGGRASQGNIDVLKLKSIQSAIAAMKTIFASEILFGTCLTTAKLSILFFYHQVFYISAMFNKAVAATGTVCLLWYIIVTFIVIFQCHPINAYWNKVGQQPYCMHSSELLLGYEITNLFLDVAILILPIGMIRKLQLPTSRKISIYLIFLLGGFVCFASMMRLRYIWIGPDHYINIQTSKVMVWTSIQLGMAITCSCLPTYGPLFSVFKPIIVRCKDLYRSLYSRGGNSKVTVSGPVNPTHEARHPTRTQDSITKSYAFRIPSAELIAIKPEDSVYELSPRVSNGPFDSHNDQAV